MAAACYRPRPTPVFITSNGFSTPDRKRPIHTSAMKKEVGVPNFAVEIGISAVGVVDCIGSLPLCRHEKERLKNNLVLHTQFCGLGQIVRTPYYLYDTPHFSSSFSSFSSSLFFLLFLYFLFVFFWKSFPHGLYCRIYQPSCSQSHIRRTLFLCQCFANFKEIIPAISWISFSSWARQRVQAHRFRAWIGRGKGELSRAIIGQRETNS